LPSEQKYKSADHFFNNVSSDAMDRSKWKAKIKEHGSTPISEAKRWV